MCQTKEVGMNIGATLGKVEKVDANMKGFCLGKFLRVRVLLDISMPLRRGRKVCLGEHGQKWVELKYERLPIFCYLCGRVDHNERDFMQWVRSNDTHRLEEKQFGPWLLATPERLQKSQMITTTTNGESGREEGGRETLAGQRDKEDIPRQEKMQSSSVFF